MGLLSSHKTFCNISLCIYMTISTEMKDPVEYSGDLHYAALTDTSICRVLMGRDVVSLILF